MNTITAEERGRILARAIELAKNKTATELVIKTLMTEFEISKDRAGRAAARGWRYWRHPLRKQR